MGVIIDVRRGMVLLGAFAALMLSGCAWLHGARPADEVTPEPQRMSATRTELLLGMEDRATKLRSLTAVVQMWANNESRVVPATVADHLKYRAGKDYRKKFERAQVNAALMMKRSEGGARNVSLTGTVVGPSLNVRLLGRNDAFWASLPNIERKDATDPRGTIYVGVSQRVEPRRQDLFSIRPQDIWDLLFTDELLMPDMVTYMETWPGFYVINFLRPESPERIFSKIWISREDLTVGVHQIFDGNGQIIAEARFANYTPVASRTDKTRLLMPVNIMMMWPRDRLVLHMELSNIRINEEIQDKSFEPVELPQYRVMRIDDIPVSGAAPGMTVP